VGYVSIPWRVAYFQGRTVSCDVRTFAPVGLVVQVALGTPRSRWVTRVTPGDPGDPEGYPQNGVLGENHLGGNSTPSRRPFSEFGEFEVCKSVLNSLSNLGAQFYEFGRISQNRSSSKGLLACCDPSRCWNINDIPFCQEYICENVLDSQMDLFCWAFVKQFRRFFQHANCPKKKNHHCFHDFRFECSHLQPDIFNWGRPRNSPWKNSLKDCWIYSKGLPKGMSCWFFFLDMETSCQDGWGLYTLDFRYL